MEKFSKKNNRNVVALFNNHELKGLFKSYLILMGVVEILIFFVSFTTQIGPDPKPFPWKTYFFAAFIVPVVITFLLGLFVMAFNKVLYGGNDTDSSMVFVNDAAQKGYIYKFQVFLYSIRQVPFLLGLLLLGVCAGVIYKIDTILFFIGRAGEKTAQYVLLTLAIVLAVAVVFAMVWMFLNYNLRKKTLEYQYKYKSEVVEKTGLIIMDDNTVVDEKGQTVDKNSTRLLEHNDDDDDDDDDHVHLLPPAQ